MKIVALIPARSGSKGIKNKNIAKVGKYNLLYYSVKAAKKAGIKDVIVSTDSEQYQKIAKSYGAECPFLRPKKISGSKANDESYLSHFINWCDKNNRKYDLVILLRPTSPFRNPKIINEALRKFKELPEADSLRSAHMSSDTPFKWFKRDLNGYFMGITKSLTISDIGKPRQEFEKVYIPNGYVDILRTSVIRKFKEPFGKKLFVFITNEILDIDTNYQMQLLKMSVKYDLNYKRLIR